MNAILSNSRRHAGLICAVAALAVPGIRAAADDAASLADAFPNYESYIKVSGEAPFISGDHSAFASHNGLPTAGDGGIEELFYTKDLSNSTNLTFDGHALDGSDDYLGKLDLTSTNLGSVEVGYKRFRTFYDGVGGFFPLADKFQALSGQSLHVDRGSFWAEAKLARPDAPVFTISFHDDVRTGMKDSSEWAPIVSPTAVIVNGALVGNVVPANTPYIAPNVMILDEHHDVAEASMKATVGKTTETIKATVDTVNNLDSRSYVRYPNSIVKADPSVTVQDDQEARRSTSFKLLNQTETELSNKLALETGLTYLQLSDANGGNWITPSYSATANAIYPTGTALGIYGGSKYYDYIGNIFLKYTPTPNWLADVGFREESDVTDSAGGFATTSLATTATTTASTNVTTAHDLTYSHFNEHIATPEASLQYTGIDRVSLYASYDDRINRSNQHWINPYAATTITGLGVVTTASAPIGSVFFQEANQDNEDAKVGANWNASTFLTIRAEVYRKDHQNRFVGSDDIIGTASYGALYVTGYTFTGTKLSVILKPIPELSFSTRYQPQTGMMSVTGNTVTGGSGNEITSGKAEGQLISETIDWTPSTKIYVQGNLNLVYNYIQTAYPVVVVSATTNIPTPIQNANENYITGSALCGFVLDKADDVQLQGIWSQAQNYNPQIAAGGQPYGASFLQESATVGLKHKFSDRLLGEGKAGYLRQTNGTTGGFTNYRGPLFYAALTYSL
jgi:hypothetical protein